MLIPFQSSYTEDRYQWQKDKTFMHRKVRWLAQDGTVITTSGTDSVRFQWYTRICVLHLSALSLTLQKLQNSETTGKNGKLYMDEITCGSFLPLTRGQGFREFKCLNHYPMVVGKKTKTPIHFSAWCSFYHFASPFSADASRCFPLWLFWKSFPSTTLSPQESSSNCHILLWVSSVSQVS